MEKETPRGGKAPEPTGLPGVLGRGPGRSWGRESHLGRRDPGSLLLPLPRPGGAGPGRGRRADVRGEGETGGPAPLGPVVGEVVGDGGSGHLPGSTGSAHEDPGAAGSG